MSGFSVTKSEPAGHPWLCLKCVTSNETAFGVAKEACFHAKLADAWERYFRSTRRVDAIAKMRQATRNGEAAP